MEFRADAVRVRSNRRLRICLGRIGIEVAYLGGAVSHRGPSWSQVYENCAAENTAT